MNVSLSLSPTESVSMNMSEYGNECEYEFDFMNPNEGLSASVSIILEINKFRKLAFLAELCCARVFSCSCILVFLYGSC